MKEKKVLIYFREFHLRPTGGPAGYLYNLKKELEREKINNISFISGEDKNREKKILLHKLPKFMQKIYYLIARIRERRRLLGKSSKKAIVDLNNFDIVHFHSTISLYECKDSLNQYNGKVVLTSHSPKAMFLEKFEDRGLLRFEKLICKKTYMEKFSKIDEYAFNRADYIIFPCKEAEECYYNTWNVYYLIHEKNKHKYRYLTTGIDGVNINEKRKEYRNKYNIPEDAFVISYVGRHNETKGYKKLKEIAKKIFEEENNIYFLIGGKEEPIKGLNNKRWIEVGWTNHPHDLINSSDMFILPNKETYFDLILLEVLSIGKIVLMTNTGGNKYFKKFKDSGMFFYDYENIEEAVIKINHLKGLDLKELELKNKKIFVENFTTEIFTKEYLKIINKM